MIALAAITTATIATAALGALPAQIAPRLKLYPHADATIEALLQTWLHNMRIAGWPFLFIAIGVHRARWRRHLVDVLLATFLVVNTTLVGAAIAAGGTRIAPFLVHLPLEWAALAISAAAWLGATRASQTRRELVVPGAAFVTLLALAATLETYGVPHL